MKRLCRHYSWSERGGEEKYSIPNPIDNLSPVIQPGTINYFSEYSKSVHRFSNCYMRTERWADKHGEKTFVTFRCKRAKQFSTRLIDKKRGLEIKYL
jgi:hypothetical protein